jgi:dTDP-4-dehydrorhamnose reductase
LPPCLTAPINTTTRGCTLIDKQIIALIGAQGMLAGAVKRSCPEHYHIVPLDLPDFDITDYNLVLNTLEKVKPDGIINCAAHTNVDACESERDRAEQVNTRGPANLARAAKLTNARLVHISTDFVFDGEKGLPYVEEDVVNPQSVYGRTKALGEQTILDSGLKEYFIVRTSWLYGPGGKNFVDTIIRLAKEKESIRVVSDQTGSPTYTEDLARALWSLVSLNDTHYGIYHYANEGQCSWYEFAQEIIGQLRKKGDSLMVKEIIAIESKDYPQPAKRPAFSVLSKDKIKQATGIRIPFWQVSLERYIRGLS